MAINKGKDRSKNCLMYKAHIISNNVITISKH